MSVALHPQQNYLLRALPPDARARIFPHLELEEMPLGRVLCEHSHPLQDVYFPTSAVVAPLRVVKDDAVAQVAVIGNDGVAGLSLNVGGETTAARAVVQFPGHAFRLNAQLLQREYARYGALHGLLLRYTQALLAQMAQTMVCHANHPLEQRLCRWLLLTLDRVAANRVPIEPYLIEQVLGASAERVKEALQVLGALGVIQQSPDELIVRDRPGLEQAACECYSAVRTEFARLLPRRMENLIDVFPSLTSTLINGLSASTQREFITQLQGALVRGVSFDVDTDTCSIALEAEQTPDGVRRNGGRARHARRIPVECQYWANLDADPLGRILGIDILRPPALLKEELLARAAA
jgi:CRP-like cAMP-binding protein